MYTTDENGGVSMTPLEVPKPKVMKKKANDDDDDLNVSENMDSDTGAMTYQVA